MNERIRISEIFGPTIQGEGPLIGRPTVFVRTGGCDYRCTWCDTLYAVLPAYRNEWAFMTPADIMARVEEACWRQSGTCLTVGRQSGIATSGVAHHARPPQWPYLCA